MQVYGVGLAVLSLLWIVVRIAGRSRSAGRIAFLRDLVRESAQRGPRGPLRRRGRPMAVAGRLRAARRGGPGIGLPRAAGGARRSQQAFGPAAWILLALLAVVAVAALWDRWGRADLVGTLLVAATVPCLAAGPMLADRAAASTLRWGLAVAFVAVVGGRLAARIG